VKVGRIGRQLRNGYERLEILQIATALVEFAQLTEHFVETLAMTFQRVARQCLVQLEHEIHAKIVQLIGLLHTQDQRCELALARVGHRVVAIAVHAHKDDVLHAEYLVQVVEKVAAKLEIVAYVVRGQLVQIAHFDLKIGRYEFVLLVEFQFERQEIAIVKEHVAIVVFQVNPRLGQVFQCGHVAKRFVHGRRESVSHHLVQCIAKLPANDGVAVQLESERVVPKWQGASFVKCAQDQIAYMLLFGRTFQVVYCFHKARMLSD
jgi:hypothetical protein